MGFQLGFIGVGNMGGTLAAVAGGSGFGSQTVVSDQNIAAAQTLRDHFHCTVAASNEEVAQEAAYLFLGVKPQQMASVLEPLVPVLRARQDRFVLVSMAAGVSIAALQNMAGGRYPVLRILPNTACKVGKGMILVSPSAEVRAEEADYLQTVLAAAGRIDTVDEPLMDAAGTLTGCTGAWAYLFMEALSDGAVEIGVPRAKATAYAAQAVLGAAAMVLETGQHPGQLKDAVCSPNGTTIAGVHALEHAGLRAAAMDAMTAAFRRTKELAAAK